MKTIEELKLALSNNVPLKWNDPEVIEGNDYTLSYVEPITDDFGVDTPILVQYNDGGSEAEVLVSEIDYKRLDFFQVMFFDKSEDREFIESRYFEKEPTIEELEEIALNINSTYCECYIDVDNDETWRKDIFTIDF